MTVEDSVKREKNHDVFSYSKEPSTPWLLVALVHAAKLILALESDLIMESAAVCFLKCHLSFSNFTFTLQSENVMEHLGTSKSLLR